MDGAEKRIYELHAQICQTLSNPKRLEIIDLLRDGELTVEELASRMGVNTPNASQHLAIMRRRGVLVSRREGANVHYRLANPKLLEAYDILREVLREQLTRDMEALGEAGYAKRKRSL